MKKARKNKMIIGWVAASLAFAFLIAGFSVAVVTLDRHNRANRREIENLYQQNIYQMSESVSSIEVNMSKLMISNEDAETAVLLNDTYHHSQAAISALNVLPIDLQDKSITESFLNQLGDWCLSQCKKILNTPDSKGEDLILASAQAKDYYNDCYSDCCNDCCDASFNGNLAGESDKALYASAAMDTNKIEGGESDKFSKEGAKKGGRRALESFEEQSEELYIRAKKLAKATREAADRFKDGYQLINNLSDGIMVGFDTSKQNTETETETPALIYDGPFSDSQTEKNFKGLKDKPEISVSAAIEKAEKTFKSLGLRGVESIGETSSPAAFALYGSSNFGEMYINISKNGGIVLTAGVPCDNTGKTSRVTEEKCKQLATEYAKMCGYDNVSPVWYSETAGYATVNLTPTPDDIVIYPDLVKIKVCLVTGDFKGIEAMGYCRCHHERNLTPAISKAEAQKSVNSKLEIIGSRLAVIPKGSLEPLCYEFAAEYKGLDYFVYIDATTGKPADIMRVINSEQGKLVM